MPTYTHRPVLHYLAVCENRSCTFREEHRTESQAIEAMYEHRDAHELRHTCRYDEHAGWVGMDDCNACDYEKPKSLRRGRAAS